MEVLFDSTTTTRIASSLRVPPGSPKSTNGYDTEQPLCASFSLFFVLLLLLIK